jgi:hypothetical protein
VAKSIKLLQKLKRDLKNERKGYNDSKRLILAQAMSAVVEFRSDQSALEGFLRLSEAERPKKDGGKSKSWITTAVVVYVTNAKSENAKKLAWKYARILEHLHDFHQIPIDDIPAEIRDRGGIEAVVRLAAEENPIRQKKDESNTKKGDHIGKPNCKFGSKKVSPKLPKSAAADKSSFGDDTDDESNKKADASGACGHTGSDDYDTLRVSIDHRLRRKLLGLAVGRRVKLIGIRTDEDGQGTDFEVRKVAPILSGLGKKIAKKRSKYN